MGKVNQLWQDQFDARMMAYMEANPGVDAADAYEAVMDVMGADDPDPDYPG